jgi:uracil-DNA glycosylase
MTQFDSKSVERSRTRHLNLKVCQDYYLGKTTQKTLIETVKNHKEYLPKYFVIPHPSPRNNIWKAKNEWFEKEVLPELKFVVINLLT